jgi:GMP synthase-like glutamine amidotransferase
MPIMNVHVLQHVPFEGVGSIENWLRQREAKVSYTRFFENWTLPRPSNPDLIIVMGGPMSVHDEDQFPWLAHEKRFVREAMDANRPMLGICLGAQLLAQALGSEVHPGAEKEIGWFEITRVASKDAFEFPAAMKVLHWHGETFTLPHGAMHLARSKVCEHQAFEFGRNIMGLQFHLETTPASLDSMIRNCRAELVPGRFVQSEEELGSVESGDYASINGLMSDILDYLISKR